MMASGIYTWLFILSYFAVQSANCDDLHQQIGKYLDNFKEKIERKYDAKLQALEEKFENQIAELKREFLHREDAYKTVIDRLQKELKGDYLMVDETDENIPGVENVHKVNGDEFIDTREEVKSDESLRPGETVTRYHDKRGRIGSDRMKVRKRQFEGPKVAFFSSLTNNQRHFGINQDIPFDNVLTNIGAGFIARHGVFVAPVAGTYVLFTTVNGESDWGHFMVNGNIIAKLNIQTGQSSQMVIIHMNQGDDASIQGTEANGEITGDRYSTFSGFLLYPDDIDAGTTIVG